MVWAVSDGFKKYGGGGMRPQDESRRTQGFPNSKYVTT